MTLIDFTLSNARRFYSSMGNPLGLKGLSCNYFKPEQRQSALVHLIFTVIYQFKSSEIEFVFYKSNQLSKVELQSSTADVQVRKQSSSTPTQLCTSFHKTQCDCLDG